MTNTGRSREQCACIRSVSACGGYHAQEASGGGPARNGDGTFTYEAYPEPIHYLVGDGQWETVDSSLVPQSDPAHKGWKNKANTVSLSLPETLGSEWVSIETSASKVACRPAKQAAAPEAAAASDTTGTIEASRPKRVKYRSAFGPGVDVQYDSTAEGLKETIVLDNYRGKNVFTFDLDTGSLTPELTESGGVALYSCMYD